VSRPGRPLRIGFLTERMLLGFGVDLVIHKTAEGLATRGYDVTVFTSVSDGTFENDRYRIVRLGIPASPIFPYYEWTAARRALPVLRAADVDLFVIETFPLFGVCSTVGFPWWVRAEFLYMRLAQNWVYFPFARRIVSISAFLRDRLPFFLRGRTRVIHPGTDHYTIDGEPDAARAAIREKLGVGKDDVLLLYVGRLNPRGQPYKGTADLVACYGRLRAGGAPVRLLMVGYGAAEDEAWLAGQGIHCWRSAPLDAMGAIYSAADLYVTASRWEGFDMPMVEAQRFGNPVVALNVGAHPEVARPGETGFLVDDIPAFEAAVRRLVDDAELRRRMGERARVFAAPFSWENGVAAYDQVIGEALGGGAGWTR
jgi:glycosyltransferase involved in cell wall biosynthesis